MSCLHEINETVCRDKTALQLPYTERVKSEASVLQGMLKSNHFNNIFFSSVSEKIFSSKEVFVFRTQVTICGESRGVVVKCRLSASSIEYEKYVYSCVIRNFESVPFFAFPMGVGEVSVEDLKASTDNALVDDFVEWAYGRKCVSYLVLEDCGPITLAKWWEVSQSILFHITDIPGLSDCIRREQSALIVQISKALFYMEDKGLMHADLHWKNIAVQKYESLANEPSFTLEGMKMTSIIKIYDWDYASVEEPTNLNLRRLGDANSLSHRNLISVYDKVSFLRFLDISKALERYIRDPLFLEKIRGVMKTLTIDMFRKYPQYSCIANESKTGCKTDWPDDDMRVVIECFTRVYEQALADIKL